MDEISSTSDFYQTSELSMLSSTASERSKQRWSWKRPRLSNVCEAIEARGLVVVLANPLKLKALTAERAKSDKNDAEMLAELLWINTVPASYLPPKEIHALRELTRHRSWLVAESTGLRKRYTLN